jgi:Carboxypeptidase regulatory-like domain
MRKTSTEAVRKVLMGAFATKRSNLVKLAMLIVILGLPVQLATQGYLLRTRTGGTEIIGRIRDMHGQPVAALKISLMNWFGVDFGSAVSDDKGIFHIENVTPGSYYVKFRPLAENSRGETMVIKVPAHSMRMNLTVTRNPPAMVSVEGSTATT